MGIVTKLKSGGSSGTEHLISSSAYGTCATAAGTVTKEVVLSSFDTLTIGMTIHIKFTNANSVANPTLKIVASSGGTALVDTKPIYRYGTTAPSTSAATSWQAGSVISLTYDGVGWIINDWLNDNSTYYYESIYCVTAANEAAKVGTSSGYTLQPGHFQIWMKNSNTAQSALTLSISGKDAKPIYINGSASGANNYTLPLGYYLVYYDGTNYYFRTDGKITAGDVLGTASGNVTNVAYDTTNKRITKTIGTLTTEVVTLSTLKTDMALNNVENTKLSTWTGSSNITTLGTISTGTIPLANISGAGDLKAIEAIAGDSATNSGFLKRTGANTWALDTNVVSAVSWDDTNKRITVTNNGTTTSLRTIAQLKSDLGLGTAAYTASTAYATSGHTHTTTVAAAGTNDTSSLTLGFGTKYKLTAGGTDYIFTMPANPDTNALYSISSALSSHKITTSLTASGTGGTSTSTDFTLAAGNYISLTDDTDNRKITIASTDHTYTLTNALSSHKFTWTFTAGGSGSGSTTTTAELVAGSGISLTDDTTNKKITIDNVIAKYDTLGGVKPWYSHTSASSGPTAGSNATAITVQSLSTSASRYYAIESDSNGRLFVNVPWTDTHSDLATVDSTIETTGYITWYEGSTIGTNVTLSANNGLVYVTKNGTTSDVGYGALRLGNTTGSGSDGNKQGKIYLYSDSSGYGVLQQASTTTTVTNTLPTTTGTLINSAGGQTINGDLTITGTLYVNESTIPHL